MKPEFREHEWEKLYVYREFDDHGDISRVPVYVGFDLCNRCRVIRIANPTLDTWYMRPNWDTSGEEPHCVVKGYEEIV